MTMHLAHPALTLAGKKKGRAKFRTAEDAQRARELDQSWAELQKRWAVEADQRRERRALAAKPLTHRPTVPPGRETPRYPSLDTGGVHHTAPVHKVYTGTKVLGIATMHKSNAVPVFAAEDAVEISRMRRG